LREAVSYANGTAEADCGPGTAAGTTTINLPAGLYALTGGTLSITGSAVIDGAGGSSTSIDADNSAQVINIGGAADVSVNGVTVTGGLTAPIAPTLENGGVGGGIYNDGTLTIAADTSDADSRGVVKLMSALSVVPSPLVATTRA
jgi:hypothetical protein